MSVWSWLWPFGKKKPVPGPAAFLGTKVDNRPPLAVRLGPRKPFLGGIYSQPGSSPVSARETDTGSIIHSAAPVDAPRHVPHTPHTFHHTPTHHHVDAGHVDTGHVDAGSHGGDGGGHF